MPVKDNFFSLLLPYQKEIETKIAESLSTMGAKNSLRDACEYALKNGGKRFRPALVYLIAKALGQGRDVSHAALAVEFFHTASLIVDDLPCMDDEKVRRGKPALHLAFNEATALLATYALIAAGYEQIRLNAVDPTRLSLAFENASYTTGILGATGGQFFDLFPPHLNESALRMAIQQKTGALFELSFVLGWVFGGGALSLLPSVKKAANHFGMAFQIVDDFGDLAEDRANGRTMNYPALVGEQRASDVLQEEIKNLHNEMKKLQLSSPELLAMIEFLEGSLKFYSAATNSSS